MAGEILMRKYKKILIYTAIEAVISFVVILCLTQIVNKPFATVIPIIIGQNSGFLVVKIRQERNRSKQEK